MKTRNINIAIPENLHTFLKVYAAQRETTMKDVVINSIMSLKTKKEEKKEDNQK